jgi:hypothetical protein
MPRHRRLGRACSSHRDPGEGRSKEEAEEVKHLAKAEKTRVKQQTQDMKADIKRAVKG